VNWLLEHTTLQGAAAYDRAKADCEGHTGKFSDCVVLRANECKQHMTNSWSDCHDQSLPGWHLK
jgi:hypothetical protein